MKNLEKRTNFEAEKKSKLALNETSHILAEVMLGAPSKDCRGQGVCRIILVKTNVTEGNGQWKCSRALMLINLESRYPKLYFVKDSMCDQMIRKYFYGGFFIVDEGSSFDLGRGRSLHLKAGGYPVIETESYFLITLKD